MSEFYPERPYSPEVEITFNGIKFALTYFNSYLQHYYWPREQLAHIALIRSAIDTEPMMLFGPPKAWWDMASQNWPSRMDQYPRNRVYEEYLEWQSQRLDGELDNL